MVKMEALKNMNKLHWLPLEILDKRYTKQTRKWYKREFSKKFDLNIIKGKQLTSKIENGSFLDAYGTNYYKFTQLGNLSKQFRDNKIKNNDVIFIDDLWMPGIEGIRYMEKMGKDLNVKIYGVIHAGSWIPSDDIATKLGNKKWCQEYERSIFDLVDGIFVGSDFHKKMILSVLGYDLESKIYNTGLPFYPSEIQKYKKSWNKKENIVIFPHRLHPEKHPEYFDKLKTNLNKYKWKFIKTMDLDLNKQQYLDLVSKSKIMVSYADQENFGFSTLEAATLGNVLILPNRLVYPEFYPKECLYNNIHECEKLVAAVMKTQIFPKQIHKSQVVPYKFENSINKMCNIMIK